MTFTLPSHLRKKDEDTIALMFERAIVDETQELLKKLKEAVEIVNKPASEVGMVKYLAAVELVTETYEEMHGLIEGDATLVKIKALTSIVNKVEKKLLEVNEDLMMDHLKREAERNVENFIPEEDF